MVKLENTALIYLPDEYYSNVSNGIYFSLSVEPFAQPFVPHSFTQPFNLLFIQSTIQSCRCLSDGTINTYKHLRRMCVRLGCYVEYTFGTSCVTVQIGAGMWNVISLAHHIQFHWIIVHYTADNPVRALLNNRELFVIYTTGAPVLIIASLHIIPLVYLLLLSLGKWRYLWHASLRIQLYL